MTEEECLTLVRRGGKTETIGRRKLYELVAPAMLRYFVHNGASQDEARDILQETLIRVFRAARSYSDNGSARAWLWQIARNCFTDHLRKRQRLLDREVMFDDEESWARLCASTPDLVRAGMQDERVDECVSRGIGLFGDQMPNRAYVLTLHMEGTSIEEIAAQIGRSVPATKEYLSQCRKKLGPFIASCLQLLREGERA